MRLIALAFTAGLTALFAVAATAQAAVEISSAPTRNMNCSAGVCTPTAKDAVLNVNDLVAMLSSADTTVKTDNGAVTIGIVSPLAWASTHRLTLDANLNVNIKAQVMVEGTAGLTIVTNDGGTGGDLMFYSGGMIDFWDLSSSLIINGNSYVLANDIQGLASDIAANPNGYFGLAKDYDAGADGTYFGSAIPTDFGGTFEGLGHTITKLSINGQRHYTVGLFAEVVAAVLRDIRLEKVEVFVGHNGLRYSAEVGALAGGSEGTIINSSVAGTVDVYANNFSVGGLVGKVAGTVARSYSTATVTAGMRSNVGGLIGWIAGGEIRDSRGSGDISAGSKSDAGGLVGLAYSGGEPSSVARSFATGIVMGEAKSTDLCIGGLVGKTVDGVYGLNVVDSYARGILRTLTRGRFGGLFGCANSSRGPIHTSYSTGLVPNGKGHDGGFAGNSRVSDLSADYWDIDTSGQDRACANGDCSAVIGLSDAQLRSGLPTGFDPNVWAHHRGINHGYPYLIANPPPQ